MRSHLIAVAGFKRSGKNSVADWFVRHKDYRAFAFADAVRDEVQDRYGISAVADHEKEIPLPGFGGDSYRDLLRKVGQDRRAQDPWYWVKRLAEQVEPHLQRGGRAVISDLRFDNELAWVRQHAGLSIWVWRPAIESDGHVSEQDHSSQMDIQIHNDASLADLHARLRRRFDCAPHPQFGYEHAH